MQGAAAVIVFILSIAAGAAYFDANIRAWLKNQNSNNIHIKRIFDLLSNEWPYSFAVLAGLLSSLSVGVGSGSWLLGIILGFSVSGFSFIIVESRRILLQRRPIAPKASFYPVRTLAGKTNYKRYIRIDRAGLVSEHIYLSVPDADMRERIVCKHYLMFLSKRILQDEAEFEELSRDAPWDFSVKRNDGLIFNIEITALADNELQFKVNKREEEFALVEWQPMIALRRLQKIVTWFPDEEMEKILNKAIDEGRSLDDLVENPLFTGKKRVFVSEGQYPDLPLEELLKVAIERKIAKKHSDKERTVLLLDNRTSAFSVSELYQASEKISDFLDSSPFKEIWFYTGFYSNDDGNESEFAMLPLKAPESHLRALYST